MLNLPDQVKVVVLDKGFKLQKNEKGTYDQITTQELRLQKTKIDFDKKSTPIQARLTEKNLSEVQKVAYASKLKTEYIFYIDNEKNFRIWNSNEKP